MLKVAANTTGLFLNTAKMAGSCLDQLQLGARRSLLCHHLLDVGVGHFVRIEFWTVAGQVEHLDRICVPGKPCLNQLAVMHPKVVEDEEHLFACPLDQSAPSFFARAAISG